MNAKPSYFVRKDSNFPYLILLIVYPFCLRSRTNVNVRVANTEKKAQIGEIWDVRRYFPKFLSNPNLMLMLLVCYMICVTTLGEDFEKTVTKNLDIICFKFAENIP